MKTYKAMRAIGMAAFFAFTVYSMRTNGVVLLLSIMLALSVGSLIYGRLFCGYLCPFHAFDLVWGWVLDKAGISRIRVPGPLKSRFAWVPITLLFLALVVVQVTSPYTPIKIRLPFLFVAFVFLALFSPAMWHRYMCPFGLIMRMPALRRFFAPSIDQTSCTKCKKCVKVCPTNAIVEKDSAIRIESKHCILCYQCVETCTFNSIKIKTMKR